MSGLLAHGGPLLHPWKRFQERSVSLDLYLVGVFRHFVEHLLALCGRAAVGASSYEDGIVRAVLRGLLRECSCRSLILFTNRAQGIITCFAVPPMLTNLNIRSGFIFGATSLPISVFMWFFLPETKGRAAAEIDELFERKIPAWKWAKTKTVVEEQMMSAAASRRGEIGV